MHANHPLRRHLAFAIVAAVLILRPSPAWAQCTAQDQALPLIETPWDAGGPFRALVRLEIADCLGGPMDDTAIAASIREALKVLPDDANLFRPAAAAALDLVDEHLQKTITSSSPDLLRDVRRQVNGARATLGSGVSPALPTAWELDAGRVFAISVPLQGFVDSACEMRDARCGSAFDTVKEVLRIARLTRLALLKSETPGLQKLFAENTRRAASWEDYFSRARSQYIWELALNGWRMGDTREDISPGVKAGFRAVPTSQILLLHPYVAMEYANAEVEGNKFNGTVLVDLVGYNRWSWKSDGTMGFAIGGSLLLAASDHTMTDDVGLGLMLHVNHQLSVGMVFGGDDPTWVVSGDVAQLWTKVSELRKGRMMTGK